MPLASLSSRWLPHLWRRWWGAVFLLALLLLVGGRVWQAYQQRIETYRHQVETALRAVSQLQAANIADWRVRHLGDAADLTNDPLLMQALAHWSAAPTPERTSALQERLRSLEENLRYTAAFFVDTQGVVRLESLSQGSAQQPAAPERTLDPLEAKALRRALDMAHPVDVELHRSAAFAFPFFGVLAPVYGPDNTPLGAIWLVLHAQARLAPLLETPPNSNRSAESMLVRREGPWVQYLIPPRLSDAGPQEQMHHILEDAPQDVVVQAAQGERGILHGVDYRGQAVLAFASSVRDTPWILVTKVDQSEALAQAQRNEWLGMALLASLLLLLGGSAFAGWQWQARRREQTLRRELQYSLQWLDSAQKAARVGYFAYYARSGEFFMSSMASAIFGLQPQEQMTQQRWRAMLHPQERDEVLRLHQQAQQQCSTLHTQYRILIGDEQERWLQVWGEYAIDPQQNSLRMTGTVQDITERRQSDEQLERYRHTLEEQVRLDPLTQLANRRALDEALPLAWAQAQQQRRPLALLMVDIDHFKAYNDHYGHVGGDHCLQKVAAALATALQREGELVARYGGEEFAVLLPDADSAQARVTAQRLCATVRALALEHLSSPVRPCVTISVGATCLYPENSAAAPGIALLFEQADTALYQAKNTGRDRAVLWVEPAQPQQAAT